MRNLKRRRRRAFPSFFERDPFVESFSERLSVFTLSFHGGHNDAGQQAEPHKQGKISAQPDH
jgi:hypothetical protein